MRGCDWLHASLCILLQVHLLLQLQSQQIDGIQVGDTLHGAALRGLRHEGRALLLLLLLLLLEGGGLRLQQRRHHLQLADGLGRGRL